MPGRFRKLHVWRSARQIARLLVVQVFSRRRVLALVRAGGLGDTICILGSLAPLRAAEPEMWVVMLTPAFCSELIETFSLVDQAADLGSLFHYYCKLTCRRGRYKKMLLRQELRDYKHDLVMNLASEFAFSLGVPVDEVSGKFVVPKGASLKCRSVLPATFSEKNFLVIIHTGPTWAVKEYPVESWDGLIKMIKAAYPLALTVQIGFDGARSADATTGDFIVKEAINLVNKLSLIELAALMKMGKVFIGIDSGPLHVAMRQNLPAIALFGPTLPQYIVSQSSTCRVLLDDIPCIGCHHLESGPLHWKSGCPHEILCMRSLSPAVVFEEVKKFLGPTTGEISVQTAGVSANRATNA